MNTCFYGDNRYSEGTEICQQGRVMRCIGGAWSDTGRDCPEGFIEEEERIQEILKDIPTSLEERIKELLKDIPTSSEEGEKEKKYSLDTSHESISQAGRNYVLFAEKWSLTNYGGWVTGVGAETMGEVCGGSFAPFKIPSGNIYYIDDEFQRCPDRLLSYKEIRYRG
ncbi:hypothetical protein [Vreelandella sulfidaeris]